MKTIRIGAAVAVGLLALLGLSCQSSSSSDAASPATAGRPLRLSGGTNHIRQLLTDVAAHRGREMLEGRILGMSGSGAASQSDAEPISGLLWIEQAQVQQSGPERLKIQLRARGWRWLERTRQQLGAEFTLDQYLRFSTTVRMEGLLDFAYDPQQRVLTLWLVPVEPVEADFEVTGDLAVGTDDLWSWLVGGAAGLVGGSPEQRAQQKVVQVGARKIVSRLDHGLTWILDLCTGRQFTKMGHYPAGQLPEMDRSAASAQRLERNQGRLYRNGLLLAGPFGTEHPLMAELEVLAGGTFEAVWVAEATARKLAETYYQGQPLPDRPWQGANKVAADRPGLLREPAGTKEKMMLLMRPIAGTELPITLRYTVRQEGDARRLGWADCTNKSP